MSGPDENTSFITPPSSHSSFSAADDISLSGSESMSFISSEPDTAPTTSPINSPEPISPADDHDDDDDDDDDNAGSDVVDSLPSSPDSESDLLDNDSGSDAEREWKESLQQLELLLTMVIVPYLGRYFGRKCAYWGWKRWMEWRYPVEVVVTNRALFEASGAVSAAAPL